MNPEIKSRIGQLLTDATDEENTNNRTDLLERYLAEPYGDEVDGRSKFVDASASDAVEAILPEIMDVFMSTPELVEFLPQGPEDEDAAKQETAAVSHIFWQKNQGFHILYTWTKESMIQQNSYCWRGWIEKERTEIEEYEALTFEEYQAIVDDIDDDYDVLSISGLEMVETEEGEFPFPVPNEKGEESIDFRYRCVKSDKEYLVEPFPQEDFFHTPRWGKVSLDGIPCCGRRHRDKTLEDWIAYGFSRDSLEKLSEPVDDEEEQHARHHTRDLDESEEGTEYLELYEVYCRVDINDDGINELVRVWCTDDATTIMEWEGGEEAIDEVSHIPISTLTPFIMPHRHVGRSVVENVDDIARVKTVLMRQLLDNTYLTNYSRPQYDENEAGENLAEDLANPAPGAPIRTGGALVDWQSPQPVANSILPLLDKFDSLQEMRTGATRYNQGLDANTLNKTASGISQIMGASQKKAKLIARTFAETGLRDLFLGIHRDLRSGPMKEIVMRLRGQWANINPRTWKHRSDMTVNVGMGRGDRDERRQGLMFVGQIQRELMQAGSRMVDESKIYATVSDAIDTYGIDHVEKYMHDPERLPPPPPPPPPPPDPLTISAESQAKKQAADAQRDAAKLKADERERERKHETKMMELRLRELELTNKIENERDTLDLKEKEAVMKDDLERDKLAVSGTPAVPYGQVTGNTE